MNKCPICFVDIVRPNCWVKYHIRYGELAVRCTKIEKWQKTGLKAEPYMKGEIIVLACKYCNWTERQIRTGQIVYGRETYRRLYAVREYHAKFGLEL